MRKILCIFRNLHGVKFADFNFISVFTRFASFATFIKFHVSRPSYTALNSIFYARGLKSSFILRTQI